MLYFAWHQTIMMPLISKLLQRLGWSISGATPLPELIYGSFLEKNKHNTKGVISISSYWYVFFILIVVFCLLIQERNRRRRIIRKNKKLKEKGIKKTMPTEMINECIGKEVYICVEGELGGFKATVLSVQDNWMKVEEKSHIRYVNGDMISQIYYTKNNKK